MQNSSSRLILFAVLTFSFLGMIDERAPRIFLIGDSTMADKALLGNPERGWGQLFPALLNNDIIVENHARNGRSTKSFIREGRWDAVLGAMQAGDYVLIQFGHNDAKKEDSTRYAAPHTDYRTNLLRFVHDAQAKKAIPVLLTPVCRRRFDESGKFYDVHGDYPVVVRELGAQENVPVLDIQKRSFEFFERLGVDATEKRFLRADSGVYSGLPHGKKDDTHFVPLGAIEVAQMVAEEIRRLDLPLRQYLRPQSELAFEGTGKLVVLDNFYNNEWKKDSAGIAYRYHYLWHDSANSGFSQLAKILLKTGAVLDTLCQQPTQTKLQHAAVYIIVDPDTKQETENPNYITNDAANAITEWVNAGGVLVLLGNDKGNAEFEHFNLLSERFGFHFNNNSRNPATAKEFDAATFTHFPSHPLFTDVRRIFIKDLSTLSIQEPAKAIFTDGDDVIMAFSKIGKGAVFAVGDPWFYNEYMGTWRLPEGYDNAKAAENLFRWLFSQPK